MVQNKVMDWHGKLHHFLDAPPSARALAEMKCEPIALAGPWEAAGSSTARIWTIRITWGFVALGLLVRLVRFWVCYPLFPDEAFVAVNFLNRDYAGLLKPLDYSQVAPPLFLWIELFAVRLLGFCEWTLRLWPMLCGLASVLVFRFLAGRLLGGLPLLFSVALFATAAFPIRHSAEAKPYASDLLAALVLLTMAVEWSRSPQRNRYWWILALVAPILMGLSHPAIFVAAGLSLALLPVVLASRKPSLFVAYAAYNLTLIAAFGGLYLGFTSTQSAAVRWAYRWGYWRAAFPPWDEPWKLPLWLIETHTGNMLAYPVGDRNGASTATFLCLIAGIAVLWRHGRRTPLWLLLSPFAMGLLAAILGQYPYGGATRITIYQAPSICILSGLGIAALIRRLAPARQRRYLVFSVGALAALGAFWAGRDLLQPYRTREDQVTRQFARWFWTEYGRDADVLCAAGDLGLDFLPKRKTPGACAVYLCHRRIFAPATAERKQGNFDVFSEAHNGDRPVRLVFVDEVPRDNPRCAEWLAAAGSRYQVGAPSMFTVHPGTPALDRERYVVVELMPKGRGQLAVGAADSGGAPRGSTSVRR
ncbi:MAG: hypothetical protein ACLQIB_01155 [Isosphaeraceae bacterium]